MHLAWRQPHKYDKPQDFAEARLLRGLFRCQQCEMMWPLPVNMQDGYRVCQRCVDALSPVDAQNAMASERARNASDPTRYLDYTVLGAFEVDSAPIIQSYDTTKLSLTRGGASKTIAVTGVNLTTSDTWSSSNSTHITVTPAVNSSLSVTLTISADVTTTRGDYNLTFNSVSQTPSGILSVR